MESIVEAIKMCECGCGQPVKNRFVRGHNTRVISPFSSPLAREKARKSHLGTKKPWVAEGNRQPEKKRKISTASKRYNNLPEVKLAASNRMKKLRAEGKCKNWVNPFPKGSKLTFTVWNKGLHRSNSIQALYDSNWFAIREQALERDKVCQICGTSDRLLGHHIMPLRTPEDNRLDRIVTLCKGCHNWVESLYRKYKKVNEMLLFSGGIDSTIAWFYLNKPPIMFCCIGHKYMLEEFVTVLRFAKRNNANLYLESTFDLGHFEEENANIPARNLHLVNIASYYGNCIYLVSQLGEQGIPDRSKKFYDDVSNLLTYLYGKIKTVSDVFGGWTKQDMVKHYLDTGGPKEELWQTYSCQTGNRKQCGNCKMCFRTAIALDYNGILPEGFFKNDIWCSSITKQYIEDLKTGKYSGRRAEQTIEVLKKRGLWNASP